MMKKKTLLWSHHDDGAASMLHGMIAMIYRDSYNDQFNIIRFYEVFFDKQPWANFLFFFIVSHFVAQ